MPADSTIQVAKGTVVTLQWTINGDVEELELEEAGASFDKGTTSCTVTPSEDTTYELKVRNSGGETSQTLHVGVHEGGEAVSAHATVGAKMSVPLGGKICEFTKSIDAKYLTIKFSIACEATGTIEAGGSEEAEGEGGEGGGESGETEITPLGLDDKALKLAVAHSWMNKQGWNILGIDTAFTELKLEGASKLSKEGFEVGVEGSGKFACGVELSVELTLIKLKSNWHSEGPGITIGADFPWFPFEANLGSSIKLTDVQLHPVIEIEFEPNWKAIIGEVGKDVAEDTAGEAAGEEVAEGAAALVGADALIVGGILLAGVGTIGAAILTIEEGDEIAETHAKVIELSEAMTKGFKLGASGGEAPTNKAQLQGYAKGVSNYNAAYKSIKNQNPSASGDDIRAAIAANVDDAAEKAEPEILAAAQKAVWENYASNHQDSWYHSYEWDRWAAWANIYSNVNRGDPAGNPEYARYRNSHTPGQLGM